MSATNKALAKNQINDLEGRVELGYGVTKIIIKLNTSLKFNCTDPILFYYTDFVLTIWHPASSRAKVSGSTT